MTHGLPDTRVRRRPITAVLLAGLVFFGLYFRERIPYLGVSGIHLALMACGWLLLIHLRSMRIQAGGPASLSMFLAIAFFGLFLLMPLAGAIVHPEYTVYQLWFATELGVMMATFLTGYLLAERGVLSAERLAVILFSTGLILACLALYATLGVSGSLRRMDMFSSRNYAAVAVSLSLISGLYLYWSRETGGRLWKWVVSAGVAILLCALVLVASRQAMMAFALVSLIVYGISVDIRKLFRAIGLVVIAPAVVLIAVSSRVDLSNWARRLSSDVILRDLSVRLELWSQALTIRDFDHLLLGRAFLYEEFGIGEYFPHNIFVSALLYGGVFVGLALLIGLLVLTSVLLIAVRRSRSKELAFVLGILLVVISYVSFSGNITRVFNFYFVWGCSLGLFTAWGRAAVGAMVRPQEVRQHGVLEYEH